MTNGASGDINNLIFTGTRAPRSPFEQIRIVASKAADACWRAVKKSRTTKLNHLSPHAFVRLTCLTDNQNEREIKLAQDLLKRTRQERDAINKRTSSVATRVVEYSNRSIQNRTGTDSEPSGLESRQSLVCPSRYWSNRSGN